MTPPNTDALTILTQVVQVFGWPFLVGLAWKVSRYVAKAEDQFTGLGLKIDNLGSNHMHELRDEIRELRQAILTAVASRK